MLRDLATILRLEKSPEEEYTSWRVSHCVHIWLVLLFASILFETKMLLVLLPNW